MTTPITVHNLFDDSFIGTRRELIFADIEFSYPEGKEQRRHVIEIHLEDQDGYPLFSSPINPGFDLGSKFARKGLPGSFLLECPRLEDVEPAINRLVDGKHLIFGVQKRSVNVSKQPEHCPKRHLRDGTICSISWGVFNHSWQLHMANTAERAGANRHCAT